MCQVLLSREQITCESRTSITPYLNNWLFCIIKKPVQLVGCGCDASLYVLLFPPYHKCAENEAWKSSWIVNNLLEVPVCCIMEYFYSSFVLYFYASFVLYFYASFVLYFYSSFVLYFYSSFVLYFYSSFVLYFVSPCRQSSNYGTTRKKILSDTTPKRLTRFSYFLFVIYPSI